MAINGDVRPLTAQQLDFNRVLINRKFKFIPIEMNLELQAVPRGWQMGSRLKLVALLTIPAKPYMIPSHAAPKLPA